MVDVIDDYYSDDDYEVRIGQSAVVPELGGSAPPIFGRSVNPIQTGGGQIMPTITTGPPKVFHLPAPLMCETYSS